MGLGLGLGLGLAVAQGRAVNMGLIHRMERTLFNKPGVKKHQGHEGH